MAATDARHARERTIISQVLGTKLDAAGVQSALDLWDQKFAGRKSVPLIEFVNEIQAVQTLEARERHELRLALYRGMIQAAAGPTAPTRPASRPAPTTSVRTELKGPPAEIVFLKIVQHYGEQLRELGPVVIQQFLAEMRTALEDRRMPGVLGDAMATIAMRGATPDGVQWGNSARMHMLAQGLYVAACKAAGPVQADRILLGAVSEAKKLDAAKVFAPTQFL